MNQPFKELQVDEVEVQVHPSGLTIGEASVVSSVELLLVEGLLHVTNKGLDFDVLDHMQCNKGYSRTTSISEGRGAPGKGAWNKTFHQLLTEQSILPLVVS